MPRAAAGIVTRVDILLLLLLLLLLLQIPAVVSPATAATLHAADNGDSNGTGDDDKDKAELIQEATKLTTHCQAGDAERVAGVQAYGTSGCGSPISIAFLRPQVEQFALSYPWFRVE